MRESDFMRSTYPHCHIQPTFISICWRQIDATDCSALSVHLTLLPAACIVSTVAQLSASPKRAHDIDWPSLLLHLEVMPHLRDPAFSLDMIMHVVRSCASGRRSESGHLSHRRPCLPPLSSSSFVGPYMRLALPPAARATLQLRVLGAVRLA